MQRNDVRKSIKPRRSAVVNEALEERTRVRRKKTDVKIWENRLRMANQIADPFHDEYQRNLDFYVGKQIDQFDLDLGGLPLDRGNILVINRILAAVAQQQSQILPRLPWWKLKARRPSGDSALEVEVRRDAAEHILNYIMRYPRNRVLLNTRLALISANLAYGALEFTYTPDEGFDPNANLPEETGELLVEPTPDGRDFVEVMGGMLKRDERGNVIRRGGNRFVIENANPASYYKLAWRKWTDIAVDPEGGNDDLDHRWIATRMAWDFEPFMGNPMFTNKEDIILAANFIDTKGLSARTRRRLTRGGGTLDMMSGQTFAPTRADRDLMRLFGWKIWHMDKREVLYMVDGHHTLVAKFKYPKYIDAHPLAFLKFHEVPGEWFPYPPVTPARPLARSYNLSRSQKMNHLRRFNRKYLMRKGMLAPEEAEKLKDPDDGVVIEFQSGSIQDLLPLQDAPLDSQIYADMERDITDFDEVYGSSSESRQVARSKTATQSAIVSQASTARENDIRELVRGVLLRIGKIGMDCIQATLPTSMAIAIDGPRGQAFEGEVSRLQIQGDFDTDMDVIELEAHDIRTERVDLTNLMQVIGPAFFFLSPLASKRFFEAWRWHDPDLVQEFTQIAQLMLEAQAGQGQESGSPKTQTGTSENGANAAGRSEGRAARVA